jgi:hypothetical protein
MCKEIKKIFFIIIALCINGFVFTQTTYPKLRLYDNTITTAHKGELQFGMSDVVIENSFGGMDGTLQIKNWGFNGYTTSMTILHDGNVGIGTTNPNQKFVVAGNSSPAISIFDNTSPTLGRGGALLLQHTNNNSNAITYAGINAYAFDGTTGAEAGHLILKTMRAGTLTEAMRILSNGNVGIGTIYAGDANYKLFVETGIRTRKVKVDIASWADYVFSSAYKLPSLKEVEAFIKKNNHLPDVPSEAEVKKEGLDLGENQALLLKKIEELTLYIIEQGKQIENLKKEVKTIKNEAMIRL